MMTSSVFCRRAIRIGSLILIAALTVGCAVSTPEPTPTPLPPTATQEPTATFTPEPTDTPTRTATASKTATPKPTNTPSATPEPSFTPTPRFTNTPRATSTPTKPPTPPLLDTIKEIRVHVDNIGGALDRLYHGSGVEACAPLLTDYYAVVNAPVYDVSGQAGTIQGAYGLYREGVAIVTDQISKIRDVCERGGGTMSALDFDVSRMAINEASGRMGTAIGMFDNP